LCTESFYDDETFSGNNLGSVTIGNLTLQRSWINPSTATAFVRSARTKYDTYGNAIASFDPLSDGTGNANQGHFREMTYDTRFHSYPIQETIHVGNGKPDLVFQATYDEGLSTMLSSTDFNSNTATYTYDALARLTSVVKPYDTVAFPTMEYDYALAVPADGGIVNFVETRQLDRTPGTAGSKRDHYLISRQFSDGLGRALMTRSEAEPAPGQTTPRVVVAGAVLFNARQKPVRALNPFFTLQTGSLGELLAFENIEASGWQGQFHENGSLVALNLASAQQTSTEYDATLRVVRATNPDGTRARTEYEPLATRGFDENDTDPASPHFNTPMVSISDGLGRLIRVDEMVRLNDDGTPSGSINTWTTRYQYDLNDRLTRITDSQNNVKLMRYDGLKRKTFMNDPDCGVSTNIYDDASNLIETVDAKGQRITYTYDGVNRTLTDDYHDDNSTEFSYHRSPDVTYHYDEPAASVDQGDGTRATARNVKGALAYVEDITGEEHTSFDARGRIEWTVKRILDPELSPTLTPESSKLVAYKTAFEYDSVDRVTRMIYPDNDEVTYQYNARSLLDGISGGPTGNILSGLGYLPSAQQERIGYGNGVQTSYAYDNRARLTRLLTQQPLSSTELVHFTYDFDPVSNIRGIDDRRPESLVPAGDPRRNTQRFQYDSLYRLTRVQYNPINPQPSTNLISYRYDRLGNMLAQSSDITHLEKGFSVTDLGAMAYGGAAGRSNRVGRQPTDPPGPHALTSISQLSTNNPQLRQYPYDANGNMTAIDGLACTWDFLNRLVAVEDDTMRAEYRYDFTGRRIIKRVTPRPPPPAARPSASLYPGKHFEIRDQDQPTKYVFNGSTRVAHVTGSLSTNTRIQRFRIRLGWNLLGLAVSASDLSGQLQASGIISAAYSWKPQTSNYLALLPGVVPAGTVLWVNATTNATIGVVGTYSDPVNRQIAISATYLASTGLEAWTPNFPLTLAAWSFDAQPSTLNPQPTWLARLTGDLASLNELPRTFAPGNALYVIASAPSELEAPDPTLRIRYYHQDHLGSSSVLTDADGALIEETAFYPFGIPRNEHRLRQIEEAYKFTQKERDRESGLHYFGARYLAGAISRFASVDPLYANMESAGDPQALNLYVYGHNSPLQYIDPTGLNDVWIPGVDSLDDLDLEATGQAIGTFMNNTAVGGMIKAPPKVNDAASFSGGIGDAIIDPLATFGGFHDIGFGGAGQTIRRALGINNVNTASPDYKGGRVLSSLAQVALGLGATSVARGTALVGGEAANLGKSTFDPLAKTQAGGPFATTQRMGGGTLATGAPKAFDYAAHRAAELAAKNKAIYTAPIRDPEVAWLVGMAEANAARLPNKEFMNALANAAEMLFR